ncbi:MAG TPA: hypothetical protein VNQ57_10670 [Ureibacillus sp.]|nr:hypothetical protein [Ureibacillus sp.]
MNVIEIVLAAKPDADHSKLNLAIMRIESFVKEYCNRCDIPPALNFLVADMVIDYLSLSDINYNPEAYTAAKSIKEGDVSVELSSASLSAGEASLQGILSNYKSQLNKYRKLRW